MLKKIILCVLVIFIATSALAQNLPSQKSVLDPSKMGLKPKGFLDNLLDPNKFSMTHSYSLSFFNVGNQSLNQGLYLNTMTYQFSDPLLMQVAIGYVHQPFGGFQNQDGQNGKMFVQRAMLQYKPSENMTLRIDFQQIPSSMYSPYGYGYGYGGYYSPYGSRYVSPFRRGFIEE
jgi:hypothetical protein